jgi:hypothetical protein
MRLLDGSEDICHFGIVYLGSCLVTPEIVCFAVYLLGEQHIPVHREPELEVAYGPEALVHFVTFFGCVIKGRLRKEVERETGKAQSC